MAEPSPGAEGRAELVVTDADTAQAIALEPDDVFPPVFATARMVGLMETAAARVLRAFLGPGEMSVGVDVRVEHAAPTPVGARVRATAVYRGRQGKLYVFDVRAEDETGEIGAGTHKRAVVTGSRLVAGAERRRKPG